MSFIGSYSLYMISDQTTTIAKLKKNTMIEQEPNVATYLDIIISEQNIIVSNRTQNFSQVDEAENDPEDTHVQSYIRILLDRIDSVQSSNQITNVDNRKQFLFQNIIELDSKQTAIVISLITSCIVTFLAIVLMFHRSRRQRNKFHITRFGSLLVNNENKKHEMIKLLS
ncbi:unnamed protein product [Adineta ricciae]|uniref:Uncharacterized protein n=2 Tax=Adineta ricciae TaxID=249248 RepID=A0A815B4B0_ADIRI|nr:unnamed protein product [Adineta ricciae]